jgi:hypothetical protein
MVMLNKLHNLRMKKMTVMKNKKTTVKELPNPHQMADLNDLVKNWEEVPTKLCIEELILTQAGKWLGASYS